VRACDHRTSSWQATVAAALSRTAARGRNAGSPHVWRHRRIARGRAPRIEGLRMGLRAGRHGGASCRWPRQRPSAVPPVMASVFARVAGMLLNRGRAADDDRSGGRNAGGLRRSNRFDRRVPRSRTAAEGIVGSSVCSMRRRGSPGAGLRPRWP
jgi:hypothetical protein